MKERLGIWAIAVGMMFLPCGCNSKEPSSETVPRQESKVLASKDSPHEESLEEKIMLTKEQIRSSGIEIVKAARKPLRVELSVFGEIATDTDRVIQLRPDEPGMVKEIPVALGDMVEPNMTLVRYQSEGAVEEVKEIKAPSRGVIVGLYAQPQAHVDPAVPLVTLADTSRLRCGLDVYEKDIGQVRKGQRVRITATAFPSETFDGVITYISPRVDENSRTIKVRVDVGNTGGKLKFGMFIRGFIQVGERQALVVPETAIQKIGGSPVVFVAEQNNSFVHRLVKLGESANGLVEIKSGVEEGESIVSKGSFALKSELNKGEMGEGE